MKKTFFLLIMILTFSLIINGCGKTDNSISKSDGKTTDAVVKSTSNDTKSISKDNVNIGDDETVIKKLVFNWAQELYGELGEKQEIKIFYKNYKIGKKSAFAWCKIPVKNYYGKSFNLYTAKEFQKEDGKWSQMSSSDEYPGNAYSGLEKEFTDEKGIKEHVNLWISENKFTELKILESQGLNKDQAMVLISFKDPSSGSDLKYRFLCFFRATSMQNGKKGDWTLNHVEDPLKHMESKLTSWEK